MCVVVCVVVVVGGGGVVDVSAGVGVGSEVGFGSEDEGLSYKKINYYYYY